MEGRARTRRRRADRVRLLRTASWDTAWGFAKRRDEIWAIWSPLEAFGAALLVAAAVLGSRRGRLGRDGVDGFVFVVGLLAFVAMAAFVGADFEFAGTARFTMVGAAAIAAAGALGLLTHRAPEVAWTRSARVLTSAGVVLGLSPLLVNVGDWSSLDCSRAGEALTTSRCSSRVR